MLGNIKKILGIEGVSIEMVIPEVLGKKSGHEVEGYLKIKTKRESVIQSITIKLIEKYQRGRKKSKLIDEYTIGFTEIEGPIVVKSDEEMDLAFTLPFKLKLSEIEHFGSKNFLFRGLAGIAKFTKGAKSTFRIEAEAFVEGTKLNPLVKQDIVIEY